MQLINIINAPICWPQSLSTQYNRFDFNLDIRDADTDTVNQQSV